MKPLVNLKVLDLTDGCPYITSMLADYGAEVIKIEQPGAGDAMRSRGTDGRPDSLYYAYYGRNKKSVTVNWSDPRGAEIIRRLVPDADMIVFNCAEAHAAERGLGYEQLKELNPRLVYGVLTPFGEEGPWKDVPDYDLLAMARSGLLEKTGFPERPTKFGFPLGYFYASWHLASGMLAAYLRSCDTGEGCKVSTSTWHTVFSLDDTFAECLQGLNTLPRRLGNGFPTTNPTDTFKCQNGWFSLSIGSDDQWLSFAASAGRPDWGEGTIYAHDPDRSMKHYFGDLDQQLRDYFAGITIEEADRICQQAMVPGGPCNTVKELVEGNEQVQARHMLVHVSDPVHGDTLQVGLPAKFLGGGEEDDHITPASPLGADTASVLGLTEEELAGLRAGGVV